MLTVKCYTSVEVNETSRAIATCVLSKLQVEYPGQLPDSAIRGYTKRLKQNIALIDESDLISLVQYNGPVHFVCGGWECQPMSLAGLHQGLDDSRFDCFLDMVKILNYLQKEQKPSPLYLFENTWPGLPGQYPKVDEAATLIESFLGAPVTIDAAGLGSAAHRVRLFWTNWLKPETLQDAIPKDILPSPSLKQILHVDHVPSQPTKYPRPPFAGHNKVSQPRLTMPTIVSYPKSHAYRMQENGRPGDGLLWNKRTKRYEVPTLEEK